MIFFACSDVRFLTVGGVYGILFIVLGPLLFSSLNGIIPRSLGVQINRLCYEIRKPPGRFYEMRTEMYRARSSMRRDPKILGIVTHSSDLSKEGTRRRPSNFQRPKANVTNLRFVSTDMLR